jgi:DNA-binding NtrC family response regulator
MSAIRYTPRYAGVLISGYGDVQLEQLAAQRGAYAFLHKPVDSNAFFSVVNRAVLRAKMRRKPEQVLGDDSVWYPQAVEHAPSKVQSNSGTVTQDDSRR